MKEDQDFAIYLKSDFMRGSIKLIFNNDSRSCAMFPRF